jgi:transposase
MGKGVSGKISYKPYGQGQAYLIPPCADEIIPENHPVRPAGGAIDGMGIEGLLRNYRAGGGAGRYHPQMTAELFVYGYMTKVCSSRMLGKAVREDVMFTRPAGGRKPDFRTLNDFRGKVRKGVAEGIFVTAAEALKAEGCIKLENCFIDGTKVESAAGRYTFVWKKGVEANGRKLDEELRAYIDTAENIWEDGNRGYGGRGLEEPGGKEGFAGKDVKELAGALKERLERLDAEKDGERKKK